MPQTTVTPWSQRFEPHPHHHDQPIRAEHGTHVWSVSQSRGLVRVTWGELTNKRRSGWIKQLNRRNCYESYSCLLFLFGVLDSSFFYDSLIWVVSILSLEDPQIFLGCWLLHKVEECTCRSFPRGWIPTCIVPRGLADWRLKIVYSSLLRSKIWIWSLWRKQGWIAWWGWEGPRRWGKSTGCQCFGGGRRGGPQSGALWDPRPGSCSLPFWGRLCPSLCSLRPIKNLVIPWEWDIL